MTELSNLRPARRAGVRAPLLFGLILAGAFHAACSVGDQFCKPGADPTDTSDSCPYGPPNGPQRSPASVSCAEKNAARPAVAPADCITWATLYDEVIDDTAAGKCTNDGCHGGMSANAGLSIARTDPATAFGQLTGYANLTFGGAYINDKEPIKSWFPCNVEGIEQGGSPMPPANGLASADDTAKVMNWFLCWVGDPATYGPNGMGTGAGGGGTGGAGGAGGSP